MTESIAIQARKPLNELERLFYTFISPSEMFYDVLRSTSWWLPLLVTIVCSYGFSLTVVDKIGVDQVVTNMMHANVQLQKRLATLTPEQVAQYRVLAMTSLKWSMGLAPILVVLFNLFIGAVLLASFNVAFDAKLKFNQVFCVLMYADLINTPRYIASALVAWFGNSPAAFDINNPVPTNLGYFFPNASAPLGSFLFSIDVLTIWYLAVMAIGFSIVGRLKPAQAAAVVFGWWGVIVFARIAWAAVTTGNG